MESSNRKVSKFDDRKELTVVFKKRRGALRQVDAVTLTVWLLSPALHDVPHELKSSAGAQKDGSDEGPEFPSELQILRTFPVIADPIIYRGAERLLVVLGGILCIYLGYSLYRNGIAKGKTTIATTSTSFGSLVISGIGPGLAFMTIGGFVLLVALWKGGVTIAPMDAQLVAQRMSLAETLIALTSDPEVPERVRKEIGKIAVEILAKPDNSYIQMATLPRDLRDKECKEGSSEPCPT